MYWGRLLNPLDESVLIQRLKLGDRRAAELLVEAHYERVYAVLFSFCKNKQVAEDLTQDTFVKMWKSMHRFHGLSRFSTWLYRIAYNTFVDWQRKQPQLSPLDDCYEKASDDKHFENATETLLHHVRKLPEKQREVILLHYQHDFTHGEIAKILDIPKGTVKSRLNTALQHLRQSAIVKGLREWKRLNTSYLML